MRYVFRTGHVFHSRELFDLFLSLIDDGTMDDNRPGLAVNDNWWHVLYSVAKESPQMACEAIARWFDRALSKWRLDQQEQGEAAESDLSEYLDRSGDGRLVIYDAAKSPLGYVEHILPRVVALVNDTVTDCEDLLKIDPLWSFQPFGDEGFQTHEALFSALAKSLESLARVEPADLDRLVSIPRQSRGL